MENDRRMLIVAKSAGFCFGVKRAINLAFKTCDEEGSDIFTLGQIIHNPQVVEELRHKGVSMVDSAEDIKCGTLIIRSHGITRDEKEKVEERNIHVVDATCPFVKKAQEYARTLAEEGYTVIILGDRDHPEVKSIKSYLKGAVDVVTDMEELPPGTKGKKAGIVAQTTQTQENLLNCLSSALDKFQEVRVFNTICNATQIRQKETIDIAKQVEGMIVIGGYNSANTKRLASLAGRYNDRVYHVEKAQELENLEIERLETLGVSAGASTPERAIEELIEYIVQKWEGKKVEIIRGI